MELCPCGSSKAYTKCCEKFISGKAAPQTAELMMRSRYSAYVKKEIDYIIKTTMPKQRMELDEKAIRAWAEKTQWLQLEVLGTTDGGPEDSEGTVEFVAHYKEKMVNCRHHEVAKFKKVEDSWYYEDSTFPTSKQFVRQEPKVNRNDPCPCGSGKKYKKCCAV